MSVTAIIRTRIVVPIVTASVLAALCVSCSRKDDHSYFSGDALYKTVEQYVALGEHRTATPADEATSDWLAKDLSESGYQVAFTEFPLRQFFLKDASVTTLTDSSRFEAFPLWYVSDSVSRTVEGTLIADPARPEEAKGKIVLFDFSFGEQGQSGRKVRDRLIELINAGARGIVGYKDNPAGEIVAFNAQRKGKAWKAPVVVVSPDAAKTLSAHSGKVVRLSVNGDFEDVIARNVYGTKGEGDEYIVVSTPISGWFRCGGERGPGVAVWLALSKWAAQQDLPYKFVFTGNSGHELGFWGAEEFLEHGAPPVDKTKLWIHLGAGLATLKYKQEPSGLVQQKEVDDQRNFFYTTSVKGSFETAFAQIAGNKWDTKERNGGELVDVVNHGYQNALGVSYAHPYFHMPADDATKTSPEVLQEITLAFKDFIEEVVKE